MKDYSDTTIENWHDQLNLLKEEIETELKGTEIKCGRFVNGTVAQFSGEITEVSKINLVNGKPAIMIQVALDSGELASYNINAAMCGFLFKIDDEKKAYIEEATAVAAEVLKFDQLERNAIVQAKFEADKKAAEDAKKAERDKKKLEKLRNHRAEVIRQLDGIKTPIHTESDFYVSLGYIAKHIGTVSATIPTWAESWFTKKFGTAEKKVVDETKKTVNGYSMKFAPSFSLSLKKAENAPADIQALADTSKKSFKINNTELVFELVDNYGFKFGKEQNLDDIRSKIPNNYINNFDMGYAMA